MTPLAARLFRLGDSAVRRELATCQFFECSSLMDLALEMVEAERDDGRLDWSEFARLPARNTILEVDAGGRKAFLCTQIENTVHVSIFVDGLTRPIERARTGFVIGSDEVLESYWCLQEGEREGDRQRRYAMISSCREILEKLLMIINQPNFTDHKERPTDKRILREGGGRYGAPTKWFQCRLRPGTHSGRGGGKNASADAVMPLHYVRRYFKPSIAKWVDGYWRGSADLGIHYKWYNVKPPVTPVLADSCP